MVKSNKVNSNHRREGVLAKGCKYATRCPYVMKKCGEQVPPEFIVNDVKVKCWLYENR